MGELGRDWLRGHSIMRPARMRLCFCVSRLCLCVATADPPQTPVTDIVDQMCYIFGQRPPLYVPNP